MDLLIVLVRIFFICVKRMAGEEALSVFHTPKVKYISLSLQMFQFSGQIREAQIQNFKNVF